MRQTGFIDGLQLLAAAQELGAPGMQGPAFGAVAIVQRCQRDQIVLHASPAARGESGGVRRIEQVLAPLTVVDQRVPQDSRLSVGQQASVMSVRADGSCFEPLLSEPGRPRQDAWRAPDGLPQALRMLGIAQTQACASLRLAVSTVTPWSRSEWSCNAP